MPNIRWVAFACLVAVCLLAGGCPKRDQNGQPCSNTAACEDNDDCTIDTCTAGVCHNTDDPACPQPCTTDAMCNDSDDCTDNVCNPSSHTCTYPDNGTCGDPCVDDIDCEGHPCETGVCTGGQCDYTPISNPACDGCVDDTTCDADTPCFCNGCQNATRCTKPADCIEITASNFDNFGEGDIILLDGGDIEGTGSDAFQAFDQNADGVTENTAITDHGLCFAAGGGCNQLRVNFDTTPIEFMATSGSWLHEAGNVGGVADVAYREYTQVNQAMTYVPDGKCYWISSAYYP